MEPEPMEELVEEQVEQIETAPAGGITYHVMPDGTVAFEPFGADEVDERYIQR